MTATKVEKSSRWTAARVRKLRDRLGLTQAQAGARVGVNDSMWCHWEKGRHKPARYFEILLSLLEKGALDGVT